MAIEGIPWLHRLPHPRLPEDDTPFERRWVALIVVSLEIFLMALDITIVGVVAPTLSAGLGATATQIQWAFDAFTVVMGGFVVLGGGLAERYGRKSFLQIGIAVFAAGAVVSAFAPSPGILIAGRAISGLGAAISFPTSLSIIGALFPPNERPRAIGIFAAFSAAGLASGPLVGGVLIDWFWWGAAFLVVVPFALVAIVATAVVVPPSRNPQKEGLDVSGALLSVFGLGGIVFGVIEGPDRGWANVVVLASLGVGLTCTAAFIAWELRCKSPLFDLRVFKDSRVVCGGLAMAIVYFTFNSGQLLIPQYLGYVLNLSSLQTGLMMSPLGICLILLSPRSGRLVERFGQRTMLLFSLMLMTTGMIMLALLPVWGGTANVLAGLCVFGVGFGLIVAPATSVIMVAVPKEKAGDGSAVNMISRQIGGAVGVAITGSLAAAIYRHGLSLSEFSLTGAQQSAVMRSLSGVIMLHDKIDAATAARLDHMADGMMTKGIAVAMAFSALVALLVAGMTFFTLRQHPSPSTSLAAQPALNVE
ncbi:MAG TPA: MFS transporter [Verrucomicrobiae bacterium]|nr:MFS transporter [Verrucomicrobiae bacterium]